MENKIELALIHVCINHKEVTKVEFDKSGKWLYTDKYGNAPSFGDEIDVEILEKASEEAMWPSIHYINNLKG